jgi:hypothetical protein
MILADHAERKAPGIVAWCISVRFHRTNAEAPKILAHPDRAVPDAYLPTKNVHTRERKLGPGADRRDGELVRGDDGRGEY